MCGIFGVQTQKTSAPAKSKLRASMALLRHRGPDAAIIHSEPGLGLAHTRLSLVDSDARSNQPFWDKTHSYCLIYNGEIYNRHARREELQALGRISKTASDTEVLLEMLIQFGQKATLSKLDGMFGFAFFDRKMNTLILVRDRFGMKPVFFSQKPDAFLFGSEVKSFEPWMPLKPNSSMVTAYLMKFGDPIKRKSFYDDIQSLEPGHFLEIEMGGCPRISPFFQIHDFGDPDEYYRFNALRDTQIVDEFEELMGNAVDSHALADATIGALCSGGVDSSLIVSLAARKTKDITLFHANVKGSWCEREPAEALARHLGLEFHIVEAEEQDFVNTIPKVMRHYEYPFTYHPNCAPLMMVAGLARDNGVKGLLSGEGSDELFLGYPWLGRKRITDFYENITRTVGTAISGLPGIGPILLPDRLGNFNAVRDILNGREILDDLNSVSDALSQHLHAQSDPKVGWTLDYMNHHLRTLLHRNGSMGMAASIEARFPFLDNSVEKFGVNLPGRHKLKASPWVLEKAHPFIRDKWVVRAVAGRYIPKKLSQRIKVAFWTTVFQRLDISTEFIETSRLNDLLKLSKRQLRDLAQEATPDLKLRLLHLDVWMRVCILNESDDDSITRLNDLVSIRKEGHRATI